MDFDGGVERILNPMYRGFFADIVRNYFVAA